MELLALTILMGLAAHRGSRFMTRDKHPAIRIPRDAFVQRWAAFDDAPEGVTLNQKLSITHKPTNIFMRSLAYLWECDWCMSVIVSGILTSITVQFASVPYPALIWLAASSIAGLIATFEPDE